MAKDWIPKVAGRPWTEWQITGLVDDDEVGAAVVQRFNLSEEAAKWHQLRADINGRRLNALPGDYTSLHVDGTLMMSDTLDEISDHREPLSWPEKFGPGTTVLVAGLGLGVVVRGLLLHSNIEKVVVLESSADVIELIANRWLLDLFPDRLEVRCVDALEYRPPKGETFTAAWFDIWPTICTDNLDTASVLHRRWTRRVEVYNSWRREDLQAMRRRDRREGRSWGW